MPLDLLFWTRLVDLGELVCCPRCRAPLDLACITPRCTNVGCVYSIEGFPRVSGQPVLIDFDQSIFSRSVYDNARVSAKLRDDDRSSLTTRVWDFIFGN